MLRTLIIILGTIVLLPRIDPNSWPGYHPWSPDYGIRAFGSTMSTASGNGSHKLKNLEDGADRVRKVMAVAAFCFAMEIRGSARHIFGNED